MKLKQLTYKSKEIDLDIFFNDLNLIVGQNAVGKSRTLQLIDEVCFLILHGQFKKSIELKIVFNTGNNITFSYHLAVNDKKEIETEKIFNDTKIYFERDFDQKNAEIFSETSKTNQKFTPPNNIPIFSIRRDVNEHPYLEDFYNWAKNTIGTKFSSLENHLKSQNELNDFTNQYKSAINTFNSLTDISKTNIRYNLNNLGYNIEKIETGKIDALDIESIYIKEKGLEKVGSLNLSQGMYRTLALLIFIEDLTFGNLKAGSLLLIDDFCEGLDYERATKLGKLVFEKCKIAGIQLIATSNDNLLMDVIDLEHFIILQRDRKKVSAISEKTHPKLFEDFRFTGLSNFDLFSSDFLQKKLQN